MIPLSFGAALAADPAGAVVDLDFPTTRHVALDKGFTVDGPIAPGAEQMAVVFVRDNAPPFGVGMGRSQDRCAELQAALEAPGTGATIDAEAVRLLARSETPAELSLLVTRDARGSPSLGRWDSHRAMAAIWTRPPVTDPKAAGPTRFTVKFSDPDFFQPGYGFCALRIAIDAEPRTEESVRTALTSALEERYACTAKEGRSAQECEQQAQAAIQAELGRVTDEEEVTRLTDAAMAVWDVDLGDDAEAMKQVVPPAPREVRPPERLSTKDPRFLLVTKGLVQQGQLPPTSTGVYTFWPIAGTQTPLDELWVATSAEGVRVVATNQGKAHMTADRVLSGDVALVDALLLAQGEVRTSDGRVLSLGEAAAEVAVLPWSKERKGLGLPEARRDLLARLDAVLKLAEAGRAELADTPSSRSDAVLAWRALEAAGLTFDAEGRQTGQLGLFYRHLRHFDHEASQIEAGLGGLVTRITEVSAAVLSVRRVEDHTWTTREDAWNYYVQQDVGVVFSEAFGSEPTFMVAAAIAPWPSPPGSPATLLPDGHRALSLQLGVKGTPAKLDTEPAGVDDHTVVGPYPSLPPVMLGAGVRVLPFLDLAVGEVFYASVPGGLTDAERQRGWAPYVSVAARGDLFNAVNKVFGGE